MFILQNNDVMASRGDESPTLTGSLSFEESDVSDFEEEDDLKQDYSLNDETQFSVRDNAGENNVFKEESVEDEAGFNSDSSSQEPKKPKYYGEA